MIQLAECQDSKNRHPNLTAMHSFHKEGPNRTTSWMWTKIAKTTLHRWSNAKQLKSSRERSNRRTICGQRCVSARKWKTKARNNHSSSNINSNSRSVLIWYLLIKPPNKQIQSEQQLKVLVNAVAQLLVGRQPQAVQAHLEELLKRMDTTSNRWMHHKSLHRNYSSPPLCKWMRNYQTIFKKLAPSSMTNR